MSRGAGAGAELRREDIPPWLSVDEHGQIWTTRPKTRAIAVIEPRRAELRTRPGYLTLWMNGAFVYAHRVVYAWFHGVCPAGVVVRHLDDDGLNNHPSNLAIGTQVDNAEDAKRNGTTFGTKLTPEMVRRIRIAAKNGVTQYHIAQLMGITQPTVSSVLTGRIWRHVTDELAS